MLAVIVPEPPNDIDCPLTVNDAFASLACARVPLEILLAFNAVNALPFPVNTPVLAVMFTAVTVPLTFNDVKVPSDVTLGWAAVVSVPVIKLAVNKLPEFIFVATTLPTLST